MAISLWEVRILQSSRFTHPSPVTSSPFAAEHYDPAGDFVARLVEVSDDGRRVRVAVSLFIARRVEELQEYCDYDTTMKETEERDSEGHRIIL